MSLRPPPLTAALVTYLGGRLPGAHVGSRVPSPTPEKFVRVGVGDGSTVNIITVNPVVLFECWAPSADEAETLAADAWQAIHDAERTFVGPVWINEANPRIPYPFPDPTYETRNRWQFYCQMVTSLQEAAYGHP